MSISIHILKFFSVRLLILISVLSIFNKNCNCIRVIKNDINRIDESNSTYDFSTDVRELSESIPVDRESHRVNKIPGLVDEIVNMKHYAGHIPVDSSGGFHFYWLFENHDTQLENKPLIIWLNGGPGCSSMDGLWIELGPFKLTDDLQVHANPHSWFQLGHLLFIDQPVGTGLSYTNNKNGYAKNDETINKHFVEFLKGFFETHYHFLHKHSDKDFSKTIPIYFAGESHAGHYIATIVDELLKQNLFLYLKNDTKVKLDLKGIALGNPWIDPYNQYNPSSYAKDYGMISPLIKNKLAEQEKSCQNLLDRGVLYSSTCTSLLDKVIQSSTKPSRPIMYDIRKSSANPSFYPPGHQLVEKYLNQNDVKAALHVSHLPHSYKECEDPPYFALSHQDGKGVTKEIINILNSGIRVLFYAGQYDLICNYQNLNKVLDNLNWVSKSQWSSQPEQEWNEDSQSLGRFKNYKNLQFLIVYNSGHMVPLDVPQVSLKMMKYFINKQSFPSSKSNLRTSIGEKGRMLLGESFHMNQNIHEANARSMIIVDSTPENHSVKLRVKKTRSGSRLQHNEMKSLDLPSFEDSSYVLIILPEKKYFSLNNVEGFKAFTAHHKHIEFSIDGLVPGKEYRIAIEEMSFFSNLTSNNTFWDSYSTTGNWNVITPGCFYSNITQCCGKGTCVPISIQSLPSNQKLNDNTLCKCQDGYSGKFCENYPVTINNHVEMNSGFHTFCQLHVKHMIKTFHLDLSSGLLF